MFICSAILTGSRFPPTVGLALACGPPPIILLQPSAQPSAVSQILTDWVTEHLWKLTPYPPVRT